MKQMTFCLVAAVALCGCGGPKSYDEINDSKVYFEYNKADISKEAQSTLTDVSHYMKRHEGSKVALYGNADARGTGEYNKALGSWRAGNAAHVIMNDGVEPNRVRTVSYGKDKPAVKGTGEDVWKFNRNVTIVLE